MAGLQRLREVTRGAQGPRASRGLQPPWPLGVLCPRREKANIHSTMVRCPAEPHGQLRGRPCGQLRSVGRLRLTEL